MRGKTVYKAYQQGAQYGKFGSGDNAAEGGSVVKGVSGPIHIMAGLESDIMKEHGPEGEYILMQQKGYNSFAEVPVNETTRYLQYGIGDFIPKWAGGSGAAYTEDWLTGPNSFAAGVSESYNQMGGYGGLYDMFQQQFGFGEYSEEAKRNVALEEMLGGQIGSAITGQGEMEGFIGQQLEEQMTQFGVKRDMLTTASGKLDTQTTGVQQSMKQYGGTRDIQKKTGLVTGGPDFALEDVETQGKMQMANIGAGRQDLASQRELIASQERGAVTQADIDKAQGKQRTQQALASMLTDYMSATGETIDESYIDMFTDYMEGVEGFDVEDYV